MRLRPQVQFNQESTAASVVTVVCLACTQANRRPPAPRPILTTGGPPEPRPAGQKWTAPGWLPPPAKKTGYLDHYTTQQPQQKQPGGKASSSKQPRPTWSDPARAAALATPRRAGTAAWQASRQAAQPSRQEETFSPVVNRTRRARPSPRTGGGSFLQRSDSFVRERELKRQQRAAEEMLVVTGHRSRNQQGDGQLASRLSPGSDATSSVGSSRRRSFESVYTDRCSSDSSYDSDDEECSDGEEEEDDWEERKVEECDDEQQHDETLVVAGGGGSQAVEDPGQQGSDDLVTVGLRRLGHDAVAVDQAVMIRRALDEQIAALVEAARQDRLGEIRRTAGHGRAHCLHTWGFKAPHVGDVGDIDM